MRQMGKPASVIVTILVSSGLAGCAARSAGQMPGIPSAGGSPAGTTSSSTSAEKAGAEKAGVDKASGKPTPGAAAGEAESKATHPSDSATGSEQPSGTSTSGSSGGGAGAKTPDEQRDTLDGSLQSSLAKFDAMLLKEQQEVAARRAEHGAGAGGAGGGGGGEGEGSGGSAGGTGSAAGAATRTSDKGAEKDRGSQAASGSKDRSTGSSKSGGRGGGREVATAPEGTPPQEQDDASRVPADVGDGRGDDVVARQIREAAMAEEDPKIRERLWEEYRRYKRGGS